MLSKKGLQVRKIDETVERVGEANPDHPEQQQGPATLSRGAESECDADSGLAEHGRRVVTRVYRIAANSV